MLPLPQSATTGFGPAEWTRLSQLITLQGVQVNAPAAQISRVQPKGGLIDAFLADPSDAAGMSFWGGLWSQVLDQNKQVIAGAVKGYVEVAL